VTDPAQVAAAARQSEATFGGVDVLVNNAGYGYRAAVEEGDDACTAEPERARSRPLSPGGVPANRTS
jgi:NAD(P)-dependent dehydrogenase (short-subunit alcohol dehydrogenase family)